MKIYLAVILIVIAYAAIAGWYGKADAQTSTTTIIETDTGTTILFCDTDSQGNSYCWE